MELLRLSTPPEFTGRTRAMHAILFMGISKIPQGCSCKRSVCCGICPVPDAADASEEGDWGPSGPAEHGLLRVATGDRESLIVETCALQTQIGRTSKVATS